MYGQIQGLPARFEGNATLWDIYSGGNYREQSGVWARRYILNTETCRLEQTVEKYLPCLSLAAARATELN